MMGLRRHAIGSRLETKVAADFGPLVKLFVNTI